MHHLQSQVWPEQTSLSSLQLITTGERMCFISHGGAVSSFELGQTVTISGLLLRRSPFDEFIYILEGEVDIDSAEGVLQAGQGSWVWLPKSCVFQVTPRTKTARGLAGYVPSRTLTPYSNSNSNSNSSRSRAAFPGMTMDFLTGGSEPERRITAYEAHLEPDFSTPVITYPHGEFIHILEGSGRIRLGSSFSPLQPGASVWIPAGTPFGCRSGWEGMKVLHLVMGGSFAKFAKELEPLCASLTAGMEEVLDLYDRHGMKVVTLQVPG